MTAARKPLDFVSRRITLRSSDDARTQLSNLYGVLVLSALMFDGRDADSILELAANAVSSLGAFHTDATYRIMNGELVDGRDSGRKLDRRIDSLVTTNLGTDLPIKLPDGQWRYAIALQAVEGSKGALVIRTEAELTDLGLFLLRALAQQTAAAMTSADLLDKERALIEERQRAIQRLSDTVSELKRQGQIHATLTAVSGSGSAVHQQVCDDIAAFAAAQGCTDIKVFPSSIAGGDGNAEFFLGARRG